MRLPRAVLAIHLGDALGLDAAAEDGVDGGRPCRHAQHVARAGGFDSARGRPGEAGGQGAGGVQQFVDLGLGQALDVGQVLGRREWGGCGVGPRGVGGGGPFLSLSSLLPLTHLVVISSDVTVWWPASLAFLMSPGGGEGGGARACEKQPATVCPRPPPLPTPFLPSHSPALMPSVCSFSMGMTSSSSSSAAAAATAAAAAGGATSAATDSAASAGLGRGREECGEVAGSVRGGGGRATRWVKRGGGGWRGARVSVRPPFLLLLLVSLTARWRA